MPLFDLAHKLEVLLVKPWALHHIILGASIFNKFDELWLCHPLDATASLINDLLLLLDRHRIRVLELPSAVLILALKRIALFLLGRLHSK